MGPSVNSGTNESKRCQTWSELVSPSQPTTKSSEVFILPNGEKCVTIPNSVILKHQHQWKNFILAQFQGRAPTPGALHAITNGIWSNRARDITVSKLTDASFLIKIPSAVTRTRVLRQGMWHIDGQCMFVAKWEPGLSPSLPVLTHAPVWLELRGVPPQFFNHDALKQVAGLVGDAQFCHPSTLNLTDLEVARVFTVVALGTPLPEAVNARFETGEVHRIRVSSPWLPPTCTHCQEVGHTLKRCPTAPILCNDCSSTLHGIDTCPKRKHSNKAGVAQGGAPPYTTKGVPTKMEKGSTSVAMEASRRVREIRVPKQAHTRNKGIVIRDSESPSTTTEGWIIVQSRKTRQKARKDKGLAVVTDGTTSSSSSTLPDAISSDSGYYTDGRTHRDPKSLHYNDHSKRRLGSTRVKVRQDNG